MVPIDKIVKAQVSVSKNFSGKCLFFEAESIRVVNNDGIISIERR